MERIACRITIFALIFVSIILSILSTFSNPNRINFDDLQDITTTPYTEDSIILQSTLMPESTVDVLNNELYVLIIARMPFY